MYYGLLVLVFTADYLGAEELCYVRYLETVQSRARVEQRAPTKAELVGPFEAFRWESHPGSRRIGHPRAGTPKYGVVSLSRVRYRAPIIASIADALDATDPLFRLNTDMYRFC